jgi:hypothetical protein
MEKAARINISMLPSLWHTFRVACVQRKTSASKEIQHFIEQQLAAWKAQDKETDHV